MCINVVFFSSSLISKSSIGQLLSIILYVIFLIFFVLIFVTDIMVG